MKMLYLTCVTLLVATKHFILEILLLSNGQATKLVSRLHSQRW